MAVQCLPMPVTAQVPAYFLLSTGLPDFDSEGQSWVKARRARKTLPFGTPTSHPGSALNPSCLELHSLGGSWWRPTRWGHVWDPTWVPEAAGIWGEIPLIEDLSHMLFLSSLLSFSAIQWNNSYIYFKRRKELSSHEKIGKSLNERCLKSTVPIIYIVTIPPGGNKQSSDSSELAVKLWLIS